MSRFRWCQKTVVGRSLKVKIYERDKYLTPVELLGFCFSRNVNAYLYGGMAVWMVSVCIALFDVFVLRGKIVVGHLSLI